MRSDRVRCWFAAYMHVTPTHPNVIEVLGTPTYDSGSEQMIDRPGIYCATRATTVRDLDGGGLVSIVFLVAAVGGNGRFRLVRHGLDSQVTWPAVSV